MSEHTQSHDGENKAKQTADDEPAGANADDTRGGIASNPFVVRYGLVTVTLLGTTLITIGATSVQFGQVIQSAGPIIVLSALFGGAIAWMITDYRLSQRINAAQNESSELLAELENLFGQLDLSIEGSSPEKRVRYLVQCAEANELKAVSHDRTATEETPDETVREAVQEIDLGSVPDKNTAAYDVIQELQSFDPDEPGPLIEALNDLKEDAEIVQDCTAIEDALNSFNQDAVALSKNPTNSEFRTAKQSLNQLKEDISTPISQRPPTNVRPHLKDLIDNAIQTIENFQKTRQKSKDSSDKVDLQAASAVQDNAAITLSPNSTAYMLINDLQHSQDDKTLQNTLETVVDQLNSYETVKDSVDDTETLHRELDDLQRDITALSGPAAKIFDSHLNRIEDLLERTSNPDLVQRFTIQEDIATLQDLASSFEEQYVSQDGSARDQVESLESDIDAFVREYTNNRERSHYNHGIPNRFLSIAEDFHSLAAESVGHSDDRAEAYADAGERLLDGIRDIYKNPEYSMVIDTNA